MDISKEELPITSFFTRTSKKKENLPPRCPAGKRKRGGVEAEADVQPTKKAKGKRTLSLKPTTALEQPAPQNPKHVYETSRASTSKGKEPPHENIYLSRRACHEILDTTPSSGGRVDVGRLQKKIFEKDLLSGQMSSFGDTYNFGPAFPTPPPTDKPTKINLEIKHSVSALEIDDQPNPNAALPTPGVSVARPGNHARPSHLRKIAFPLAQTSPLAARKGAVDVQLLCSSPLLSDAEEVSGNCADGTQAFSVAMEAHESGIDLLGAYEDNTNVILDDDPFAAPEAKVLVLSSQPLHLQLLRPSLRPSAPVANAETLTNTSPIFAAPLSPSRVVLSHAMEPRHPTDTIIESSQSQFLLPSADSPRRMKYPPHSDVASSQSQVLLPFLDSPRRKGRLFSPGTENNQRNDLGKDSQVIGSSQSQIEKELSLSMCASQIGVYSMPPADRSASQSFHDRDACEADSSISLSESIPRTPPNKQTSPWRALHIGSSPMSSAPHDSSITTAHRNKCVFDEKLSSMMEGNNGDMMVHRPVQKPISPSVRQALASVNDQQDTSGTVPQSNFAVAEPGAGEKHRREVQVSKLIYTSSHQHASSPSLSDEDTQDLYHAGAPPSVSEFSLWTMATDDSTQSMPPAVKDFMDMFDDDGSYPRDFPMDLRC